MTLASSNWRAAAAMALETKMPQWIEYFDEIFPIQITFIFTFVCVFVCDCMFWSSPQNKSDLCHLFYHSMLVCLHKKWIIMWNENDQEWKEHTRKNNDLQATTKNDIQKKKPTKKFKRKMEQVECISAALTTFNSTYELRWCWG